MEQKVLLTDSANDVNYYLDKGWIVKSITAQHGGGSSSYFGKFMILLERPRTSL